MATTSERIRYLASRPGKGASRRWFWQPDDSLRAAGWRLERLAPDVADRRTECVHVGHGSNTHAAPIGVVEKAKAINAQVDAWRRGEGAPHVAPPRPAGTLAALIAAYRGSDEYKALMPRTRRQYDWCLDLVVEWGGPERAAGVTPKQCKDLYKLLGQPRDARGRATARTYWPKAAAVLRVVRMLYSWGISENLLPMGCEPAREVEIAGSTGTARIWTDAAAQAFAAAADALGLPSVGTALVLNTWLGQRETDLIALPRAHFDGAAIRVLQSKRKRTVIIDVSVVPHVHQRLAAELERQTKLRETFKVVGTTLLLCEKTGVGWNEDTFRAAVAAIKAQAIAAHPTLADELGPVTFRHCRHTAVTRMHEAGVDDKDIASVTGHSLGGIKQILENHYLVFTPKMAKRALSARAASEGKA